MTDRIIQEATTIAIIWADGAEATFIRADGTARIAGWGIERTEHAADSPEAAEARADAARVMAECPDGRGTVDGIAVEWSRQPADTAEDGWEADAA